MANKRQKNEARSYASGPVRVGLLGLGTVGTGVAEILARHQKMIAKRAGCDIEIVRALVRSSRRKRGGAAAGIRTTTRADQIVGADDIDIVVELMGGKDPACSLVIEALESGQSVVTANKAIVAKFGKEIFRAAKQGGGDLLFEAAVAGGIPIIRTLRESLASDRIERITGILNGTTNYILGCMENGQSYADALTEAQKLGYAEADPTLDVTGGDAADKLAILVYLAFGLNVDPSQIETDGITQLVPDVLADAEGFGCRVKLLATAERRPGKQESVAASVQPCFVSTAHELSAVPDAQNAIAVESESLGRTLYQGPGAGGLPTGSAVVADLIEAARNFRSGNRGRLRSIGMKAPRFTSADHVENRYYLRLLVLEEPGVLASITKILARYKISIATVHQDEQMGDDGSVAVKMTTHPTTGTAIKKALGKIGELSTVREGSSVLKFYHGE